MITVTVLMTPWMKSVDVKRVVGRMGWGLSQMNLNGLPNPVYNTSLWVYKDFSWDKVRSFRLKRQLHNP